MSLLSLPTDILIIITSHLSLADLLILTQVSREFYRHVSHPPLHRAHPSYCFIGTRLWMVVSPPYPPQTVKQLGEKPPTVDSICTGQIPHSLRQVLGETTLRSSPSLPSMEGQAPTSSRYKLVSLVRCRRPYLALVCVHIIR